MNKKIIYLALGFILGLGVSTIVRNYLTPLLTTRLQVEVLADLELPIMTFEMNKNKKNSDKIFRGIIKKGSVCNSSFIKGGVQAVECWMYLPREQTKILSNL